MQTSAIVPLREADVPVAAAALARAFMDDPLQTYVVPDPAERARKSPHHFEPLLRYGRSLSVWVSRAWWTCSTIGAGCGSGPSGGTRSPVDLA